MIASIVLFSLFLNLIKYFVERTEQGIKISRIEQVLYKEQRIKISRIE